MTTTCLEQKIGKYEIYTYPDMPYCSLDYVGYEENYARELDVNEAEKLIIILQTFVNAVNAVNGVKNV